MKFTLLLSAAFALGIALGMAIVLSRVQKAINASPWETPRTPFIAALRREGERAAYEGHGQSWTSPVRARSMPPVTLLESFTMWSGVALFEHGDRVMPDGTRAGYAEAARRAIEGLRAACVALHDAADLLRQFGQTLPFDQHRELRNRNMDAVIRVERALGFDQADAIRDDARRDSSLAGDTHASSTGQRDLWVAQ